MIMDLLIGFLITTGIIFWAVMIYILTIIYLEKK